ncbi:MAG: amidohydrolase/deacetylase family metallohydrolase [Alphaproteobacteria bacterium]
MTGNTTSVPGDTPGPVLIAGGRVIDPASDFDDIADVAIDAGRIVAVGRDLARQPGATVIDAGGQIVTPGLIDLHTHVYWGGTSLGVDPAAIAARSGCTTMVDAGSAGAGNLAGFKAHVVEPCPVRVLAFLNVSFPGIFAFSKNVMVGECGNMALVHAGEALEAARAEPDLVRGIKVRVGRFGGGESGVAPLDIAIEVAEELDLPVMAHLDFPPPSRRDVLSRLRPGDVLTHCFRPFPNAPVRRDRRIRDEIWEARQRGVLMDIGHGAGSFAFYVGEAALADDFPPDIISSDVHCLSVDGPAFDLTTTMSKFVNLGMALPDVIRTVTVAPADVLRRPDLGRLSAGATADVAILAEESGSFEFTDILGKTLHGSTRLAVRNMVVGGRVWDAARHAAAS